ncbi:MAG: phospholipid carrier-dependent glycosyltransferase [Myxococcaceae bacterium]|nr:MAG: phospholipid carrier-dependent glycosyltransferase [Myxococcaceae bacterium]
MNVREGEALRPGIAEALFGDRVVRHPWVRRLLAVDAERRLIAMSLLVGALVFVPYVGAVGLWDPWESHYGEVAREMIARNDYVHPYWESSWFFSKPPLAMWMDVLGMALVGTNRTPGKLALYTEWGMRMPFVLGVLASLALLAVALGRTVNRRVGLASTVVLATMPLFFLVTRQVVTDTPFVACLVAAMACAIIGLFDERTTHRTAWWMAFYVLCGLSTLAKGLLGVGLPAVILLAYAAACVFPWDAAGRAAHWRWLSSAAYRKEVRDGKEPMPALFAEMSRMRLLTGIAVFFAVAGPWFAVMCVFPEVDNEGKTFLYRFFIHDHLNRLFEGVHTTTPGGSFVYFIEQGGYALFPWVALLPGALAVVSPMRLRGLDVRGRVAFIALIWTVFSFLLMDASATKFHHYVLPVLPGVAILVALFLDQLWEDGPAAHAVPLLLGAVLFFLVAKDLAATPKDFTDLFVYNYERPYPHELDTRPVLFGWSRRPLMTGDLVAAVLLAVGAWMTVGAGGADRADRLKARMPGLLVGAVGLTALATTSIPALVSPITLLGCLALASAGLVVWGALSAPSPHRRSAIEAAAVGVVVGVVLIAVPLLLPRATAAALNLRTPVNVKMGLIWAFTIGGVAAALAAVRNSRTGLVGSLGALALGLALWFSWSHWVDLSHHWTQRDLFWRYYDRRAPGEPIVAYMMDWKGETFYSKNTVKQIKDSPARMAAFASLPGRKWALVEHPRLGLLRQAVGPDHRIEQVDRDLNVKFVLVTID